MFRWKRWYGVGLESRVSWCGLREVEFVLAERLGWVGVGENGKNIKRGGGETLEPCDVHGCLAGARVEAQESETTM